jgi:uncharacterized membrane protein YsdA (DUF1294 family)
MEIFTTDSGKIIIIILFIINIFSFVVMARDKYKSANGHNNARIPEGLIFFLASFFGSIGVYLGMFVFRHKTRKWYFQLGIPLLIFQNIATVFLFLSL